MAWGIADQGWGLSPWGLGAVAGPDTVANLSRTYVVPAWFPGGFVDQFIRKVRFERIDQPSESVRWNRADPLPAVAAYDLGAVLPAAAMQTVRVTGTMRRIGDVAEVDTFQETSCSDPNPQLDVQVQAKRVAIVRTLGSLLVAGAAGDFDSLAARIVAAQRMTGISTPTLQDVARLIRRVTASDGWSGSGADCLVANERVARHLVRLLEEAPGGGPLYVPDPDLAVPIPCFEGVPIYVGQVPTLVGPPRTSFIYALKLMGPTGIRILHGSGRACELGVEVRPLPMQAAASKRGAFVGGLYALLIPEDESFARIEDINMDTLPVPEL